MAEINYAALKKHVMDVIKESQIKIGYTPNAVSLNYPVTSLNHFLGTDHDVDEMHSVLTAFVQYARDALGEIQISLYEEKYCLTIPCEGVKYVHENVKDSGFLTDFIALLTTSHTISIHDILQVFYKYSENVRCREVDQEEFNYVVYFEDGKPDDYFYCIDIDFGHATYHRLTPSDYADLGFDD